MSIRRLVIAALFASAGAAHADAIVTTAPPPAFVSGWTTGNGTDVLGSGVLQGNLSLVGGVAYGGNANTKLTDVLYGKVSGSFGNVDGQTRLFFERGIEASYLLASGHGLLAATLGPGKSVVGSADGAIISDGVNQRPGMSGGGGTSGGSSGGSTGGSTGGSAGGSNGGGSTGGSNGGGSSGGGSGGTSGGGDAGGGSGSQSGGSNGGNQGGNPLGPGTGLGAGPDDVLPGNGNGAGIGGAENGVVAVPEPSSIALILAGLMGACALTRRR
ncbi:MAG: PEP-CTERM sorting domain-containing protein [Telluria sp.]